MDPFNRIALMAISAQLAYNTGDVDNAEQILIHIQQLAAHTYGEIMDEQERVIVLDEILRKAPANMNLFKG